MVFCCLNEMQKITSMTFQRWLLVLQHVPGSVLWLLAGTVETQERLRRTAEQHGVAGTRLVFAEKRMNPDHLARFQLADLFLDTLPNNAHTTASDALWADLPVLTMRGSSFSGRVAASLLGAVGLEELVTEDLAAYENLALALARDPERLAQLRARLGVANAAHPLFDTRRFAADIERVFTRMTERARAGLGPQSFAI